MNLRDHPVDVAPHDPDEPISAFCPRFHYAIELIGRRWMGPVLRTLFSGPHRFNEILASIPGLSDRLLTERLRELEREGLIERVVHPGPPIRAEYALTEPGRSLEDVIRSVGDWAERWVR